MDTFKLVSSYQPTGDQPEAISKLVAGLRAGYSGQTLLGVTGSGKTFTMANIIAVSYTHLTPSPTGLWRKYFSCCSIGKSGFERGRRTGTQTDRSLSGAQQCAHSEIFLPPRPFAGSSIYRDPRNSSGISNAGTKRSCICKVQNGPFPGYGLPLVPPGETLYPFIDLQSPCNFNIRKRE